MDKHEYYDIAYGLECYHEIFATLWKITKPHFTNAIPTAAVRFDSSGGCIDFLINPDFWDSMDDYNKEFTICHEMCHVILQHGLRMSPYKEKYDMNTINMALDLAVNHLLTSSFGFKRFWIQDWEKYVWADTVFKELDLEPNKSFEYYISKIKENYDKSLNQEIIVIDHQYLDAFNKQVNNALQNIANSISGMDDTKKEQMQKDAIDKILIDFSGGMSTDESSVFHIFTGQSLTYKKIKKWETVLNKYVLKSEKEREFSQWVRLNRRLTCLKSNLFLPSDAEVIDRDFYRYNVWLFLDYSGSCSHLENIFFQASHTFDPRKFKIRKFAHTTQVAEFKDSKVKVYGGGTAFKCIEKCIQEHKQQGEIQKYPDAIFHFTDGRGDFFTPEKPENWYVFLTNHSTKHYYPRGVNFFKLEDFVENYHEHY